MITKLKPNQIFVFGSNLAGRHGKGAAKYAKDYFGAEYGTGEGLTGQCYAFPTLDYFLNQRTTPALAHSVKHLYSCCSANPHLEFLLTKVGCGLAGYTEDKMKSLFTHPRPVNLTFPEGW